MSVIAQSSRCILREYRRSDLNDILEIMTDPKVFEFELIPARAPFEVEEYLKYAIESYQYPNPDCLDYGIESKEDSKIIGIIQLSFKDPDNRICQIGYQLNYHYSGNGLLTEIGNELINYLFKNNCNKLMASCTFENQKSWELLERLGFEKEGHIKEGIWAQGSYFDEVFYGYLKRDWQTNNQ